MVSLSAIFAGLGLIFSYLIFKHQTLRSPSQLQEEISNRLQPRYSIEEPINSQVLPHTEWPSGDFYFEVWHVEVTETRWMRWKKWLPWGSFRGRTIVTYELHGFETPPQKEFNSRIHARQPAVQSFRVNSHDRQKIEVIYDSANPSSIATFVRQFRYMMRDVTFYHLNPDADLQYEMLSDEDGKLYARIFDANTSPSIGSEEASVSEGS